MWFSCVIIRCIHTHFAKEHNTTKRVGTCLSSDCPDGVISITNGKNPETPMAENDSNVIAVAQYVNCAVFCKLPQILIIQLNFITLLLNQLQLPS